MSQNEQVELKANIQLKAIELLGSSINYPPAHNTPLTNFNYNISIESKADGTNHLVFVIVRIDITGGDQNGVLASLTTSCVFDVVNFDELIQLDSAGNFIIPQPLIDIFNSISISTARGVMFSTFKGTYLHNAVLPIVDPKAFQQAVQ